MTWEPKNKLDDDDVDVSDDEDKDEYRDDKTGDEHSINQFIIRHRIGAQWLRK